MCCLSRQTNPCVVSNSFSEVCARESKLFRAGAREGERDSRERVTEGERETVERERERERGHDTASSKIGERKIINKIRPSTRVLSLGA